MKLVMIGVLLVLGFIACSESEVELSPWVESQGALISERTESGWYEENGIHGENMLERDIEVLANRISHDVVFKEGRTSEAIEMWNEFFCADGDCPLN